MIEQPEPFDCAICERHTDTRWPGAKQTWPLKPVCRYCEETLGGRVPAIGAFRDRRIIRQISALATAMESEAFYQQHRRLYGR